MDQLKSRRRSLLWSYFSVIDSNLAICDLCKQKLSHKSSSSNLRKHLLRKHPALDPATIEPKGTPSTSVQLQNDSTVEVMENCSFLEEPQICPLPLELCISSTKMKSSDEIKDNSPCDPVENSPTKDVPNIQPTNFSIPSSRSVFTKSTKSIKMTEVCKPKDKNSGRNRSVEMNEYEAVGVSVAAKLKRMDPLQAIYAESLISQILCRGLLNTLTSTHLSEIIE